MIARFQGSISSALRSVAGWVDFSFALAVACLEQLRARGGLASAREPALVAQAITLQGGRTIVHPISVPRPRLTVGPGATLALAAAALVSTLGSTALIPSGRSLGVAMFTGDPVMMTLGNLQGHDRGTAKTRTVPESSLLVPEVGSVPLNEYAVAAPAGPAEASIRLDHQVAPTPMVEATSISPAVLAPTPEQIENSQTVAVMKEPVAGAAIAPEPEEVAASVDTVPVTTAPAPAPIPVPAATPITGPVAARGALADWPQPLPEFDGVTYTAGDIRAFAIAAGWAPERLDELVRVAWCESRFRPDARGQSALGLMQVMPFWFRVAGVDLDQWSNPVANLRVALVVFQSDVNGGMQPWASWECVPATGER